MNPKYAFTKLLGYEIAGKPLPENFATEITDDDMKDVIAVANNHSVVHMIADAVEKNNLCFNEEIDKYLKKQKKVTFIRYVQMEDMLKKVKQIFEEEKIPFIPLKGAVIKDYYPQPWLRNSCDMDILVHPEDLQKSIDVLCKSFSFKAETPGSHDVSLFLGSIHIELHFGLVEEDRANKAEEVLKNVWSFSQPVNGGYEFAMRDDMFYFYHIAHMVKHFETCGIGVRHFIDLWILNNKIKFNKAERDELLKKQNLLKFEKEATALADRWFTDNEGTELTDSLEEYVLKGSTFGTVEQKVAISSNEREGKIKYIFKRLFLPYSKLKKFYPKLEGRRILTPFYWIIRIFTAVFNPKLRKRGFLEVNYINEVSDGEVEKTKDLLKELQL